MLARSLMVLAALVLAASCGGGDDGAATTAPPPTGQGTSQTSPPDTPAGGDAPTEDGATDRATENSPAVGSAACQDAPGGAEVVVSATAAGLIASDAASQVVDLDLSAVDLDQLVALASVLSGDGRTVRVTTPGGPGPHPVLLEFHGYTGDAAQMSRYSRLAEVAGPTGYLVVAIDGREQPRRWELANTDSALSALPSSDVAVVDAVLDVVLASFCGDPAEIHAAGLSNGAVFAAVLACHSRHDIAAVGSVAFTTGTAGCDEDREIPTLAIHGTADIVVPYVGRDVPLIRSVLGWDLEPAEEAMAAKAALNGCDGFEDVPVGPDVVQRTWLGCEAETVFYRIEGGGHGWPGPGQPPSGLARTTTTIDATQLIVEFFDRN